MPYRMCVSPFQMAEYLPHFNLQISVAPLNVHGQVEPEIGAPASDWLSAVVSQEKEKEAVPASADQQDASVAAEEKEPPSAA